MKAEQLMYGGVPVPYTVSWSAEDRFFLARCPYANRTAICQPEARGEGKPNFGKPHSNRQRQVIEQGRCDLCCGLLLRRTKVSLSHARSVFHGAEGHAVLQVEPLLHKECAAISMRHCPSLKRDLASGTLMIRQVTRFRTQYAVMDAIYIETITGIAQKAIGHAKVELLAWVERNQDWLHG